MRDPKRIDKILGRIRAIWKYNPDLRLCQLISNAATKTEWSDYDLYHIEDDELDEGLEKLSKGEK